MKSLIFLLFLLLLSCQGINDIGVLVPPTVDQDLNLPSVKVTVSGKQRLLHVRTFGNPSNPPLFLFHGSYSDLRAYKNICEGLMSKYFVVLWDQRGCGLSERISEEEFTLVSALDEINEMKKIYSPQNKVTILGHSWGGGLATFYTSKYPENVEQLLLIEPMPLTGEDMQKVHTTIIDFTYNNGSWNNLSRHGHAVSSLDHNQIDYRAMMILKSTMTSGYHCNKVTPPDWPIHRVGGFIENVRNSRLGSLNGTTYMFNYNFTNGIQNFKDTVLILGGSCSSLGYQMQSAYSKKHFPNCRVVEIKNAGHRMNMEQFDVVMFEISSFLKHK